MKTRSIRPYIYIVVTIILIALGAVAIYLKIGVKSLEGRSIERSDGYLCQEDGSRSLSDSATASSRELSRNLSSTRNAGSDSQRSRNEGDAFRIYYKARSADNVEIDFWGMVVDQHGAAVKSAVVHAEVTAYIEDEKVQRKEGGGETAVITQEVLTDGMGDFHYTGIRGRKLTVVRIQKEGYSDLHRYKSGYIYGVNYGGRHYPDRSNPVIFPIFKKEEGMHELKESNSKIVFNTEGESKCLNLKSGKVLRRDDDVHFSVSVSRGPNYEENNYDWEVTFQGVEGEFSEEVSVFMNEAPIKGYTDSVSFGRHSNSLGWTSQANKKFYFRTCDRSLHAAVTVKVYTYNDGRVYIKLRSVVNDGGTRVLLSP